MSSSLTGSRTTATLSSIHVETIYLPSSDLALPALVLQVTRLVDSYMLWIGATEIETAEEAQKAALQGNLSRDWACAMPPTSSGMPAASTPLSQSSSSDVALPIAQRLARRFRKQIFLSVDVPPSFQSMGQGPELLLEVEKGILQSLTRHERGH